jgi:hypothetical protein
MIATCLLQMDTLRERAELLEKLVKIAKVLASS